MDPSATLPEVQAARWRAPVTVGQPRVAQRSKWACSRAVWDAGECKLNTNDSLRQSGILKSAAFLPLSRLPVVDYRPLYTSTSAEQGQVRCAALRLCASAQAAGVSNMSDSGPWPGLCAKSFAARMLLTLGAQSMVIAWAGRAVLVKLVNAGAD